MTTYHPRSRSRWYDARSLEKTLAESAQRALTLSAARRAAVLAALLAEAARLRAAQLRRIRRQAELELALYRLLSPKTFAVLAALAACLFVGVVYLLFGGARVSSQASFSGGAALKELRRGPLGLTWSVVYPPAERQSRALRQGDELFATTPVTVTFLDGAQAVLPSGTRLRLLSGQNGFALIQGEADVVVPPSRGGAATFCVETDGGSVIAKRAHFRVRTERDASVSVFTDAGLVAVSNEVGAVDVSAGEQVHLRANAPLKVELQVPRVAFYARVTDRVFSNAPRVPFSARIFPHATLIVEEAQSGKQFARYVADSAGYIEDVLPAITGSAVLRFSQASADGRSSAPSQPIEIVVDRTPPALAIRRVLRDGARLEITGRTEVGAQVQVNDTPVTVGPDGSFAFASDALVEVTSVTITAVDAAGNRARIVHTLDR